MLKRVQGRILSENFSVVTILNRHICDRTGFEFDFFFSQMKSFLPVRPKHCARPTRSYKDEQEVGSNARGTWSLEREREKENLSSHAKNLMNTGISASKEGPRAQKYKAGRR